MTYADGGTDSKHGRPSTCSPRPTRGAGHDAHDRPGAAGRGRHLHGRSRSRCPPPTPAERAWTARSTASTAASAGPTRRPSRARSRRVHDRLPVASTARATSRRSRPVTFTITVVQNCPTDLNDEFDGTALDPKWAVLRARRRPARFGGRQAALKVRDGDMIGGRTRPRTCSCRRARPAAGWRSTKIDASELTNGGEQAGLVLWNSEDRRQQLRQDRLHQQGRHAAVRVRVDAQRRSRTSEPGRRSGEPDRGLHARELQRRRNRTSPRARSTVRRGRRSPARSPLGNPTPMQVGLKASDGDGLRATARGSTTSASTARTASPPTTTTTDPGERRRRARVVQERADRDAGGRRGTATSRRVPDRRRRVAGRTSRPFTVAGGQPHGRVPRSTRARSANTEADQDAVAALGLRRRRPASRSMATCGRRRQRRRSSSTPPTATSGQGRSLTQYRVDGARGQAYAAKDEPIFDGTAESLAQWRRPAPGGSTSSTDDSGGITPAAAWACSGTRQGVGDFPLKLQFREGRSDAGPTAASSSGSRTRGPRSRSAPGGCAKHGQRRDRRPGWRSTAATRSRSTTVTPASRRRPVGLQLRPGAARPRPA